MSGSQFHRGTRWWVATTLAVVALMCLGAADKAPCAASGQAGGSSGGLLCYTDIPLLYAQRGLDLPFDWFGGEDPRARAIEYPTITVLFMEASAKTTQHLMGVAPEQPGQQDSSSTRDGSPHSKDGSTGSTHSYAYYWVSATALAVLGCLALLLLISMVEEGQLRRIAPIAVPLVVFTAFINWDLISLFFVVAALAAWQRGRPVSTGICIAFGTAAKLYPALLLGPLVVICLRERRFREAAIACTSALCGWLIINGPAVLLHPATWSEFWRFNSARPGDVGSPWLALHLMGGDLSPQSINVIELVCMVAASIGVAMVGFRAPRTPDLATLGVLIITAFVVVNKVNSPQYLLWTLPLIALSCRHTGILVAWCVSELVYFVLVWQYLGHGPGGHDLYLVALLARLAAEVAVAASVAWDLMTQSREPTAIEGTVHA